jgi:hypothetical protein
LGIPFFDRRERRNEQSPEAGRHVEPDASDGFVAAGGQRGFGLAQADRCSARRLQIACTVLDGVHGTRRPLE